jgi:hypothetical protein
LTLQIGTTQVQKTDFPAFAAELSSTPLTAHLVLLLPFQFTTTVPIPVHAGPDYTGIIPPPGVTPPPDPAMPLIKGGDDLLGRNADGSGGAMGDITENLKALIIDTTVVNNLGIAGYIKVLNKMPVYPPDDPEPVELGKIKLTGKSSLPIPKAHLETAPFSPAMEIYLDGDFDINRSLPPEGAMTMSMGIILQTNIDTTF